MAKYPHFALHIASSLGSDQDEADDHASHYQYTGETRSAGDVDELYDLFLNLGLQGAQLAYLDFHCHGGQGGLFLGRETVVYKHLQTFRRGGFDGLFRSNAIVGFLSGELAGVNLNEVDGDGELFLAEFAHVFLRRNGGKAVARNMPWYYKPSAFWRGPIFKNDGSEIVAEVGPGASRAVLKGQFRLDENRINAEIGVLRALVSAALNSLPGPPIPKSSQPDKLPASVQQMVADGAARIQSKQVEKNRFAYTNCLKLLDNATADIRALYPSYYLKYHKACENVGLGVPLGQIVPPILNMLNLLPVPQ